MQGGKNLRVLQRSQSTLGRVWNLSRESILPREWQKITLSIWSWSISRTWLMQSQDHLVGSNTTCCSLWQFGWGPVGGVQGARQGVEFHQSKSTKTSKVGIFHSYMANMLSNTLSRNARRYLTSTVNQFIKDIGLDMGVQLVIFARHKAEDDIIHRTSKSFTLSG